MALNSVSGTYHQMMIRGKISLYAAYCHLTISGMEQGLCRISSFDDMRHKPCSMPLIVKWQYALLVSVSGKYLPWNLTIYVTKCQRYTACGPSLDLILCCVSGGVVLVHHHHYKKLVGWPFDPPSFSSDELMMKFSYCTLEHVALLFDLSNHVM